MRWVFSLPCCLNFDFRLSTSNCSYSTLLNSLLFCHFTLWHVTFGSPYHYFPPPLFHAFDSTNYLVNGQLLPTNSFSIFHLFYSTPFQKLCKRIASTLLVPGTDHGIYEALVKKIAVEQRLDLSVAGPLSPVIEGSDMWCTSVRS